MLSALTLCQDPLLYLYPVAIILAGRLQVALKSTFYSHLLPRPCLVTHATVAVEEGGARPVHCPFCGWEIHRHKAKPKAPRSELDTTLVRELLEEEVWQVYDNRLLTKAIRSMSGAVW